MSLLYRNRGKGRTRMNMKGILKRNLKEKLNEFRKEEEA